MEVAKIAARRWAPYLAVVVFVSCARHGPSQQAPIAVGSSVARAVPAPLGRPNDPPKIVRVWISQDSVAAGDVLRGHVTTTTNVASLEVRLGPRSATLKRTTFGQFEGAFHVPRVPAFLRRSYDVDLIARNAAGRSAQTQITIAFR